MRLFNPLPVARRLAACAHPRFAARFGRINLRMHNKLFVADDRFAISGGRNIADEYFMRSETANFIDIDVLAAGPIVRELSRVFDRYWNSEHVYPVAARRKRRRVARGRAARALRRAACRRSAEFRSRRQRHPLGRALGRRRARPPAGSTLLFADAQVFADTPDKGSLRTRRDTALDA